MTKCIYGIYDKKLDEFVQCVLLDDNEYGSYFTHVASDVTSPYFRKESDFDVYRMYQVDKILPNDVYVDSLDFFIDENVRNLQVITQTLNYLPLGYFKMPKEMQEQVNEQIKDSVYKYVADYLSNDQKLAISKVVKED